MAKNYGEDYSAEQVAPDINLPLSLIDQLRAGMESAGSDSGNGEGDNSGAISIGNNSFGFNFDSDEISKMDGVAISSAACLSNALLIGSDSDKRNEKSLNLITADSVAGRRKGKLIALRSSSSISSSNAGDNDSLCDEKKYTPLNLPRKEISYESEATSAIPKANSSFSMRPAFVTESSRAASSSSSVMKRPSPGSSTTSDSPLKSARVTLVASDPQGMPKLEACARACPVRRDSGLGTDAGYNTDDEACLSKRSMDFTSSTSSVGAPTVRTSCHTGELKMSKSATSNRRQERNAREKDRSSRISHQIDELRSMLSNSPMVVSKCTKSSVLTETANYIRMLQQYQIRSELDRQQLIQQMQMIGSGALGPQAASAIRVAAAKNGVWALGNFGGNPPRAFTSEVIVAEPPATDVRFTKTVEEHDYRHIFNHCSVAMAVATMGGAFIECNHLFSQLSGYTKQELRALTIFNITAKSDLQAAFDRISAMITPYLVDPTIGSRSLLGPVVVHGLMKERTDLGISVSMVKGADGLLKCFCVTLVEDPKHLVNGKPIPATVELLRTRYEKRSQDDKEAMKIIEPESALSATYTTG